MKLNKVLMMAGFAAILALGTNSVVAQQGGGPGGPGGGPGGPGGRFDPAQMRQRMMNGYREQLDVKDDAFPDAGRVGLWSKADARSQFDDLTLETLDGE